MIYHQFLENLNLFIYIIILKNVLYEFKHYPFINAENKLKLLINLQNAQQIINDNNNNYKKNSKNDFDSFIKSCKKKKSKKKNS